MAVTKIFVVAMERTLFFCRRTKLVPLSGLE
jgi:hypothetical protein